MLSHLLFAATLIASGDTPSNDPEIQEIIALLTQDAPEINPIAACAPVDLTQESAETSITIKNAIEPNMIAYKHWTGTYDPDTFTITINGVEVAQGAEHTIPATQDPITIRYDYSFVNGKRTGAKVVSYQLNENITEANITFSWNNDWRVVVDNATPIEIEEVAS